MTRSKVVGVVDIGKTNAKFALVDLSTLSEIAARRIPNKVVRDGPYPHYDIERLWQFVCDAISELNADHTIDVLSVTTHGAAAALIDEDGTLSLPVLDYEFEGPAQLSEEYDSLRPKFLETFTPRLPTGLNLGAQLFWQSRRFPQQFAASRWIVTYPQYWSFRFTGVAAAEPTSLGCHSDLWDFQTSGYSSLVTDEGWIEKMPPVRRPSDVLGCVKPELAARLGLGKAVPVVCGIHDTNASILPHVLSRDPPFAVISTGTWVIVCAFGASLSRLDPTRDCLANLDMFGRPVASARFMGGREYSLLMGDDNRPPPSPETIKRVLDEPIWLLPSVVSGTGPFPHRNARWNIPRDQLDAETQYVVSSFYLALMTAECLALTGADGDIIIEGPFTRNRLLLNMLAAATGRPVVAMPGNSTGTLAGAAVLAAIDSRPPLKTGARIEQGPETTTAMHSYADRWRHTVAATDAGL